MKKKQGFAITPLTGESHWKWRDGRGRVNGYEAIKVPDHPFCHVTGYVYEHRLIMEKHLGRYLKPNEHIHHKDGDKLNNNIENLVLIDHRSHIRKHMVPKAKWSLLEDIKWMQHQVDLGKDSVKISKIVGCSPTAVRKALDRYKIKLIVSENGHIPQKFPQLRDKAWLEEKTKSMSQRQIAKHLGCDPKLVGNFQKIYGIKSNHKPGPKI